MDTNNRQPAAPMCQCGGRYQAAGHLTNAELGRLVCPRCGSRYPIISERTRLEVLSALESFAEAVQDFGEGVRKPDADPLTLLAALRWMLSGVEALAATIENDKAPEGLNAKDCAELAARLAHLVEK